VRMHRSVTVLIAVLGVLLAGLGAANADTGRDAGRDAGTVHERGQKPTRKLHEAIVERHGRLLLRGRVDPGHGPVIVQKKDCAKATCPWHRFKRVPTHGPDNRWQVRVFAPRHGNWFWRGYVRAYGGYATSWTTHVWKTYVTPSAPVAGRQTTVQVSPPPISAASRSECEPGADSCAVWIWPRAWSSYVGRSTWRKMPIGERLR
jgi:hypothetical protein